jgi:hypothetical protein
MLLDFVNTVKRISIIFLALSLLSAGKASAQDHVISAAELQQEIVTDSQAREENLKEVQSFFSSEPVQEALQSVLIDVTKVEEAIGFLGEEELARLAAKTEALQADFAAGALTNQQITYIIIALAAAVIVLIAT